MNEREKSSGNLPFGAISSVRQKFAFPREKLENRLFGALSGKSTAEEIQKFIHEGVIITPSIIDNAIKAGTNASVIKVLLDSLTIVPSYSEAFDSIARRDDTRESKGKIIRWLVEHGVGFECAVAVNKNRSLYSEEIVELLWLAGHLDPEKKEKDIKPEYITKNLSEKLQVVQKSGFLYAIFYPILVIWGIIRALYEVNFGKKK